MKTLCLCTILAVSATVVGCRATGESYYQAGYDFNKLNKVAVLDVSGPVLSEAAKNQICDFFSMEMLKKGYSPVERSQVQALLKEQRFQTSGITTTADAAHAGRILNVSAVLLVNVPTYEEKISMSAKMVGVESGNILWVGTGYGSTGRTLSAIFGAAGGAAGGAAVAGKSSRGAGAVAGGALGGIAAYALSPQQAEQFQKVVKQVCQNLPQRSACK
jgi:hypothetical protein